MAEKFKKPLSRRAQERLKHQLRSFDLAMLALALTVLLAGVLCMAGKPDLGKAGGA